jgi:glutamyl-Q tRNA(Asp) synthetase
MHLPVAVNAAGEKLSKQTGARPLDLSQPASALWQALDLLQQSPPQSLRHASIDDLWNWAGKHWQSASLDGLSSVEIA